MSRLMIAGLMTMLAGCGLDGLPEPQTGPSAEKGTELASPFDVRERLRLARPETAGGQVFAARPLEAIVLPPPVRETVAVAISVQGVLGAEGQRLTVLVGQAGCGFQVHASGEGTISNGVAQLTLTGVPADSQLQLVIALDTDGDGQCTYEDTMWSGELTTQQPDLALSLDLATLQSSSNWLCWALEPAGP